MKSTSMVLLFVQADDGRLTVAHRAPEYYSPQELREWAMDFAAFMRVNSGRHELWWCKYQKACAAAARWWIVECPGASVGREIIKRILTVDGAQDASILASGHREVRP